MTKEEAYNLLNQAIAQINTTRQGHMLLVQALDLLAKVEDKE